MKLTIKRYSKVTLADGRTGVVVGFDGTEVIKVDIEGRSSSDRAVVKAARADVVAVEA